MKEARYFGQLIIAKCPDYDIGVWQRYSEIFEKKFEFDSSLHYLHLALKNTDKEKYFNTWNSIVVNIANTYLSINQYLKAFEYYAMDSVRRIENLNNDLLAEYFFNLSSVALKNGNANLSKYYLIRSRVVIDPQDMNAIVEDACLESQILRFEGDYAKAFKLIERVAHYLDSNLILRAKVQLYSEYSYLSLNQGKNVKMIIGFTDSAISLAKRLGKKELMVNVLKDAAFVYASYGDSARAFECMSELQNLKENINDQVLKNSISMAFSEFKIKSKLLEQNSKLKEAGLRNENTLLVSGLILTLLLGAGGWLYYKQKQKIHKQEMVMKESIIQQQAAEKDFTLKLERLNSQMAERRRIAMDLHNVLGNRLSSIKQRFENLEKFKDDKIMLNDSIQALNSQIDLACEKLREISHDQYERTWMQELELQLKSLDKLHGINANLISNSYNLSAYPEIELSIYTISEGLITNTIKYAEATEINVQVLILDGFVHYTYEDNGRGFDASVIESSNGIGFKILKDKVKSHNGTWSLETRPGNGMTIFINVPLSV